MLARQRFAIAFAALLLLGAPSVFAQSTGTIDGGLSLSTSPAYPAPGERVTLTLTSPVYDLDGSDILWRAGGTTISEGTGETSVSITAGALGESTSVSADVTGPTGESNITASVVPTRVDLLWESDTYTPPFYRGKALPSAGAHVRLFAQPYLPKAGGGFYDPTQLRYTWRLNGNVLASSSGKGKSAALINGPELFGSYTVTVDVTTADGALGGEASASISSVEPRLVLYEDHPLYGMEYWHALGATSFISDSEMSFAAMPFFAPATSASAPLLEYAWQVNGGAISSDAAHPNEITLQSAGNGTLGLLDLELTHKTNLFIDSRAEWSVTFTAASQNGTGDPFHQ